MKQLLITIAAVLVVGCGESQQSSSPAEVNSVEPVTEAAQPITPPKAVTANKAADPARGIKPEPPTAKAPDISIHEAAEDGNLEAVKQHLAAGTDVNTKGDDHDETPLHDAADWGHKEIAELLIAKGSNVNAKAGGGVTPLHWAAQQGQNEIVQLLIAKGADVNARDDFGETSLDDAISTRMIQTADLLRKHGGKTGEELKAEGN
jgi:ankyrin repeat protein